MGKRYCPQCEELVEAKVVGRYSQKPLHGILVKRRKIIHRVEDHGCGHEWYTLEIIEDAIREWPSNL